MSVRVRFAPSPTGSPHVGNIRTALFDFLLARKEGGQCILRIEDTDRTRYVEGCEHEILESLNYVGVQCDEGPHVGGPHAPYRQSDRVAAGIYQPHIDRLLADGHAYWAFDTPEELTEMREFQQINKQPIGYFGGEWRDATPAQAEAARQAGKPGVIRLRIPRGKTIVIQDAIRGRVEIQSDQVDDPVLIKADGMPTYHFAAILDDVLMEITHVIRGEEWISSAPKHVVLFEAFGATAPEFVHVPQIRGKDGKKLSKRHGDTACLDFRRAGYMGETLANFIALIGWAPGNDREILMMDEMIEAFSLRGIQPSPGVFDIEKLNWMSGHYIRSLSVPDLTDRIAAYAEDPEAPVFWQRQTAELPAEEAEPIHTMWANQVALGQAIRHQRDYAEWAVALEQERVNLLRDFGSACAFFLQEEPPMDAKAVEKWFGQPHTRPLLQALHEALSQATPEQVTEAWCETTLRSLQESLGIEKFGPVVHPTRVALTGRTVGPGLFELMAVLGKSRMEQRLSRALNLVTA